MRSFFNPENSPWQLRSYIGDTVMLSLLWVLCSIPVITIGAATAALYDATVSAFRRGETGYLGRFLSTFKRELVNSLLPTLLWGGLLALLLWLLRRFTVVAQGSAAVVAAVAFLVLLLVPLGCACWTFPLLSRFTLRFGRLRAQRLADRLRGRCCLLRLAFIYQVLHLPAELIEPEREPLAGQEKPQDYQRYQDEGRQEAAEKVPAPAHDRLAAFSSQTASEEVSQTEEAGYVGQDE